MSKKKNPGAGRQQVMGGIVPPLNLAQERAIDFLNAKKSAGIAAEKAKDAEADMIAAAQKLGVDTIKVRDDNNNLIVFSLDNKIAVKKQTMTDVKIEKAETAALTA
jgi:hypothetical protein